MRTDLASEQLSFCGECEGVQTSVTDFGKVKIERVVISTPDGAEKLRKPVGTYVTVNFEKITPDDISGDLHTAIKHELLKLLPQNDNVLVVGLGNKEITPDALGPLTADGIIATRHIAQNFAKTLGVSDIKKVSVLATGVLGQTGIESAEIIEAAAKKTDAHAVIVIDALAAHSAARLCKSIQLTDSGICPGSGVGNARTEISQNTLNIPTVAIGIPTVVDLADILEDCDRHSFGNTEPFMVTPRDIDVAVTLAANTVSHAVNCALQPNIPPEILLALEGTGKLP